MSLEQSRGNGVIVVVYQRSSLRDACLLVLVIDALKARSVGTVSLLAHGGYIFHSNGTARARVCAKVFDTGKENFLWVVGGVCEDAGIEATLKSIVACYHDTMKVCVDKVVIQEAPPLFMEEFPLTMGEQSLVDCRFPGLLDEKVFETIGKLCGELLD